MQGVLEGCFPEETRDGLKGLIKVVSRSIGSEREVRCVRWIEDFMVSDVGDIVDWCCRFLQPVQIYWEL